MGTEETSYNKLEDLQKEKLQAEINLIKARIKKDYPEAKPLGRLDKIAGFFKKWNAVILALIAVGGGFWGVFSPVKKYFDEQSKSVQFTLNENMIAAMDSLSSTNTSEAENAILVLSYYELNAIPVLLFNLERTNLENTELISNYYETINLIYNRKRIGIVDRIVVKLEENFNSLFEDGNFVAKKYYALQNLSGLLNNLNLNWFDKKRVSKHYKKVKLIYEQDTTSALYIESQIYLMNINKFDSIH
jgi:hypothetical protein